MLKITRTIQLPVTVFNESALKEGELYTISNRTDDSYVVSGLTSISDEKVTFENGREIYAEQIEQGEYQLSPVETYIDRWIALYSTEFDGLATGFFVAYDEEDAMEVAIEATRTDPKLKGRVVVGLLRLSDFMDVHGYMPHASVQTLENRLVGGRLTYVSK